MNKRRSNRGFTLLELIFVAVVLVLLMLGAAPSFTNNARRLRLETTAFDLVQLMRYANEMAISQSSDVVWVWDDNNRQVVLETQVEDPLLGPIRTQLSDKRAKSKRLSDEYQLTLTSDDVDAEDVTFFADGTSEPAEWVLTNGKGSYRAEVDRYTSQVSLKVVTAEDDDA